ncbi:peptidoglycan recognition protein family protein [Paracidovorax konjaci]|uniref:N-acetylmuramoyl-L-alanine amidase n=1 Tax=Paracidovorax konjaci TaxID=32040 RepID=A0A1I1RK53_9BURK|nr:N-acetylmuramoyl-L-alanine amidase [Paracidovorax konjaci]SFD34725.1 N-acetylmuramoyl-L-alanine amidase [Paracidovorax konjaci]
MLTINDQGMIVNAGIVPRRFSQIERQPLEQVRGIIVHQTGSGTAASTFNSYGLANANGAHFLIDKDGTVYQTASVRKRTHHVGPLLARCLAELRCKPAEFALSKSNPETAAPQRMHKIEMQKSVPVRYPSNVDSLGIELVGRPALPPGKTPPVNATPIDKERYFNQHAVYEPVTNAQNASLQWLIGELAMSLSIPAGEVFKHPTVSRKNPTEAGTAVWQ